MHLYDLPFTATPGDTHRYVKPESIKTNDFSGTYALEFQSPIERYPSVGIFKQEGNGVTKATFLRQQVITAICKEILLKMNCC
ncbi:MAG: hypothetical protein U5K54_23065 [Cytophagales bacterium]|nr:hypothetical protein [Cytophagales bacterium]